MQRDKIQAYCRAQSWELVKIYEDAGVAGATMDRLAFNQMLADAHSGLFDLILTYKIDRVSRSLKNLLIRMDP